MAKIFYTSAEAASDLGVSESRLEELVRDGKLRQFRDGGLFLYKVDDIVALSQQKELAAPSQEWLKQAVDLESVAAGGNIFKKRDFIPDTSASDQETERILNSAYHAYHHYALEIVERLEGVMDRAQSITRTARMLVIFAVCCTILNVFLLIVSLVR